LGLIFAVLENKHVRINGLIGFHGPYGLAFRYVAGSIVLIQIDRDSKLIITDKVFMSLEEEPDLKVLATRWDDE
jgi:hypothetical protein